MDWIVLKRGAAFEVRAMRPDDQADSFVEEYMAEQTEELRKKIHGAIAFAADHGPPRHNREKCRPLKATKEQLFELKENPARVVFFYRPRNVMVLTHAFTKRRGDTPPNEIARGERLKREYEEAEVG